MFADSGHLGAVGNPPHSSTVNIASIYGRLLVPKLTFRNFEGGLESGGVVPRVEGYDPEFVGVHFGERGGAFWGEGVHFGERGGCILERGGAFWREGVHFYIFTHIYPLSTGMSLLKLPA